MQDAKNKSGVPGLFFACRKSVVFYRSEFFICFCLSSIISNIISTIFNTDLIPYVPAVGQTDRNK